MAEFSRRRENLDWDQHQGKLHQVLHGAVRLETPAKFPMRSRARPYLARETFLGWIAAEFAGKVRNWELPVPLRESHIRPLLQVLKSDEHRLAVWESLVSTVSSTFAGGGRRRFTAKAENVGLIILIGIIKS
jgi:hypothetical protein